MSDDPHPLAAAPAKSRAIEKTDPGLALRLRRVDLDLLPLLHALLRTRNVTATARELGISQPAVSKGLRRLRSTFEDDLIVARGRTAGITERGLQILPALSQVLADLDQMLQPPRPFDPRTERLRIVIKTADYVSVLLAPRLAKLCAAEAPRTELLFLEQTRSSPDELEKIDFFIVPRPMAPTFGKRIEMAPLWEDEMVCIAARQDRRWGDVISADEFRDARKVIYQVGERGPFAKAGLIQPTSVLEDSPACEVPNFLVIGAIVQEAECLALVPRKLAQELVKSRDIRILDIDHPQRRLDIDAFWASRTGAKRGHAWFRTLLLRAAEGI